MARQRINPCWKLLPGLPGPRILHARLEDLAETIWQNSDLSACVQELPRSPRMGSTTGCELVMPMLYLGDWRTELDLAWRAFRSRHSSALNPNLFRPDGRRVRIRPDRADTWIGGRWIRVQFGRNVQGKSPAVVTRLPLTASQWGMASELFLMLALVPEIKTLMAEGRMPFLVAPDLQLSNGRGFGKALRFELSHNRLCVGWQGLDAAHPKSACAMIEEARPLPRYTDTQLRGGIDIRHTIV